MSSNSLNVLNSSSVVSSAKAQLVPALTEEQSAQLSALLLTLSHALKSTPQDPTSPEQDAATSSSQTNGLGMNEVLALQEAMAGMTSQILLTNLQDTNNSGNINAKIAQLSGQLSQEIQEQAQKAQDKNEHESFWQKMLHGLKTVFEGAVIAVLAAFPGTQAFAATLAVLMVAHVTGLTKDVVNVVADGLEKMGVSPQLAHAIAGTLVEAAAVLVTAVATGGESVIDAGIKDIDGGIKKIEEGVQDIEGGVKDVREGLQKIQDGTNDLKSGLDKVSDGVKAGNTKQVQAGEQQLKSSVQEITNGVKNVETGSQLIEGGADDLVEGAEDVASGVDDVKKGIDKIKDELDAIKQTLQKDTSSKNPFTRLSSRTNMTLLVATNMATQVDLLGNYAKLLPEGSKAREITLACAEAIQMTANLLVGVGAGSALLSELGNAANSVMRTAQIVQTASQVGQGVVGLAQGGLTIAQGFTQQTLSVLSTLAAAYRAATSSCLQSESQNMNAANAVISSLIQALNNMVSGFARADQILPAMMSGNPA